MDELSYAGPVDSRDTLITVALLAMVTLDRHYGTGFFEPTRGGSVILWQHLFWVFGHPEVYILILPAMGIVSEVLSTHAKKHSSVIRSWFTLLAPSVFWDLRCGLTTCFTTGLGIWAKTFFATATMLIAVPTGVKSELGDDSLGRAASISRQQICSQ